MNESDHNRSWFRACFPIFLILLIATAITGSIWIGSSSETLRGRSAIFGDVTGSFTKMFVEEYPANHRFQTELDQLRTNGKLSPENENLIHKWVLASSEKLKMPPAILWCLLFQESRLNHLEGIDSDRGASGIGQFSYYSFYEINHHLDQYTKDNLNLFITTMGQDIRPVEPKKSDIHNFSSYYYIPTAVTTSAAYLNNRYHQLQGILEKNGIVYDPQLLWLYAAMAYNKGTRSVLSLWNNARKIGGNALVEKLVLENNSFYKTIEDPALYTKSLKRIWPADEAQHFAKELKIHMTNMKECVSR